MEAERLHRILTRQGKPYVCAITDDEKTTDMVNGKPSDVLYMLHCLYHSVKAGLVKQYGERIANKMMKAVSMTDDELRENLEQKKEIPAWLKKLMNIDFDEDDITFDDEDEEDEDDSVDETDRDEEDGDSEEDEPVTYHFRGNGIRLDISIHPDDAVRSDD